MDFTIQIYDQLLNTFKDRGYSFQTLVDFVQAPQNKTIILRHDVDRLPENALTMARIEYELGIAAAYYFRAVPESWDEEIIREVSSLGHEIGYHYESLTTCKGNPEQAFTDFKSNLAKLRTIAPVSTICMHGTPLSSIDNLGLWRTYNYKELGIIAEPYLDIDFNEVFYITDTGRKWNNEACSVRDRVNTGFDIPVKSTFHLMELAGQGRLPDKVMINAHPQRWFDFGIGWVKELVVQNIKNVAKAAIIKIRK